jgi:hypothetical protein
MAKKATDRFASMAEMAAALADYLRTATPPARERTVSTPPSGPAVPGGSVTHRPDTAPVPHVVKKSPGRTETAPQRRGRRWLRQLTPPGLAGLMVLGVVLYVTTNQGQIKIEVEDPGAVVEVDGREVRIEKLGEPITLRPGKHQLVVKRGDVVAETREFTVVRGVNQVLKITLSDKNPGPNDPKDIPRGMTPPPGPPAVQPHPAPASAAQPSADPNKPAPLERGEVAKGRVDAHSQTNKAHYWFIDVPAGEYKAVVDMERADRRHSNIQGGVQLLGLNGEDLGWLGRFNEIDYRARGVFPLRLGKPLRGVVRVTADQMMDYQLGLFPATAAVPTPFFRKAPKVTPLGLGETFAPPALDGSKAATCDAFCSMTLPAGDYRLTVGFRRVDRRRSNIQGQVQALTMDGMIVRNLGHVNEIDTRAAATFKLALSEERSLIFRVVATQELEATFKVDRLQEE